MGQVVQIQKYTVNEFSDMAHHNLAGLKSFIQGHGILAPLDDRANMDLIELACALQDGKGLPDWASTKKTGESGSVMTFAEMIAAGNYDWVNENIIGKNFPTDSSRFTTENHKVFHFGKDMYNYEVVAAITKDGYEPTGLERLLAYGVKNPDEPRECSIVALGASWVGSNGGSCNVPCLSNHNNRRRVLDLCWIGFTGQYWHGSYRFLAVRQAA